MTETTKILVTIAAVANSMVAAMKIASATSMAMAGDVDVSAGLPWWNS